MSLGRDSVVVDIGNSGLKAAIGNAIGTTQVSEDRTDSALATLRGPVLRRTWIKATSESNSIAIDVEDSKGMEAFVQEMSQGIANGKDWLISSVQDKASQTLVQAIQRVCPNDRSLLLGHRSVPMMLDVESPSKLGIDRLLAAWGGWRVNDCKSPVIVVQVGTAVTVDYVDRGGVFRGGAIMAGVPLALRLMAAGTSRLPLVDAPHDFDSISVPGKNTEQAMLAGVSASLIGGVEWLARRYREGASDPQIPIVVSGGDGPSFAKWLTAPTLSIDQLVLRAMASLAMKADFASNSG